LNKFDYICPKLNIKTKEMAKDIFGREVLKDSYKVQTTDGYKKVKSKVVFNKDGDIVKTKSKTTRYTPTGNENGKASEYKASGTTVQKRKFEGGSNVPTKTVKREGIIPVKKVDSNLISTKKSASNEMPQAQYEKIKSDLKTGYDSINFKNKDVDKFKGRFGQDGVRDMGKTLTLEEIKAINKPKP